MAKLEDVKTVDMVDGEITKISYDGAEYTKVAHDFKDARTGDIFFYNGRNEYYEVTVRKSDFYGINHPVRFTEDDGTDNGYMRSCPLHPLFRKISDQTTPTLAEVSDKVNAIEGRVSALEGETIEVGDYVKPLPGASEYFITDEDMALGKVVEEGGLFGDIRVEVVAHKTRAKNIGDVYDVQSKHFRKATDEEIAEATAPKFEEGDYARTLTVSRYGGVGEGITVKVTKIHTDGNIVVEPVFVGEADGIYRPHQIEKLEGEDVERVEQFSKAGRKLNEIKKGDIVRVKDTMTSPYIREGELVTVAWADGTTAPEVSTGNGYRAFAKVELIAPVESRVDVK